MSASLDRYGLPLSTSSAQALEHWGNGLDMALAQSYGAEEEFALAVAADDGFAMAYASLAFMQFIRIAVPEAKANAEAAVRLSAGTGQRERQYAEAISRFVNGENLKASELVHEHLKDFPGDAMLLRLAQRLYVLGCGGSGVQDYPPMFYQLMKSVEPHYGDDWAFMGQYAWANHEVGLMNEGLSLAERSLDLKPDNGVAAHSVAHVYYEVGQNDEGGGFLSSWLEDYDRRAFYRVHLSWHQALFELAMGRYNQALTWYQNDIRPAVQGLQYASLADSASLIWRMNIYGDAHPPAPWQEIIDLAAPAAARPGPSFRDAHAALAFTVAGDDASFNKLVDGLQSMADGGNTCALEATLPLVKGIGAFGQGDYAEAVRLLEPVRLTRIGGSHAQRLVFEDTLLEAYLRAGEFEKATTMLRQRLGQRESARDNFWLARAQEGQGDHQAAQDSLIATKDGWQEADTHTREYGAFSEMARIA